MVINENAGCLTPRSDCDFIASMLAPTDHARECIRSRPSVCAEGLFQAAGETLAPEVAAVPRLHYDHATRSAKSPTK
jgi:hypothetical protein